MQFTQFWIWAIIWFFPNRVGRFKGGYCFLDFQIYLFPGILLFPRSGVEKTEIRYFQEFCSSWGRGWTYRVNIISSISRNSVFLEVGGDRWCVNIISSISRNSAFLEVGGDRCCFNIISSISRNSAFSEVGGDRACTESIWFTRFPGILHFQRWGGGTQCLSPYLPISRNSAVSEVGGEGTGAQGKEGWPSSFKYPDLVCVMYLI